MTLNAADLVCRTSADLDNLRDLYRSYMTNAADDAIAAASRAHGYERDLGAIEEAIDLQTSTRPLREDQRRALFAAFTDVFGRSKDQARYVFTRMVLGKTGTVSWSSNKYGTITVAEASKVLTALRDLERAL